MIHRPNVQDKATCPNCGALVLPDATVCHQCGSDLKIESPPLADAVADSVGSAATASSSASLKAVRAEQSIWLSFALFMLVVLAAFGYQGMTARVAFKKSGAAGEGAKPLTEERLSASPNEASRLPVIVDTATLNRLEALHQRFVTETDSAAKVELALRLSKEYIDLQQLSRAGFYVKAAAEIAGARVPQLWLRAANLYDDAEEYELAKPLYEKFLSIQPKNVDARVNYAIVLLKLGEQGNPALSQQAVSEMRRAVEDDSTHQKATVNLGILYMQIGKVEEAHRLWRRALALDPKSEAGRKAQELMDRFPLTKP
ncbi:MAG: tetratricopeptide repeat protein [Chloroherpetonaceae bacterium]|nr:tetratricopeptide repeat protein [Chloroherpetonaceae bacterium]